MKRILTLLAMAGLMGCASSSVQTIALNGDPAPDTCSKILVRDFSSSAVAMICYDSTGRPIGQTPGDAINLAGVAEGLTKSAILATGIGVGASLINTSPTITP